MVRIVSILCIFFVVTSGAALEAKKPESFIMKSYPKTIKAISGFDYPHLTDPDGELEKGSKAAIDLIAEGLNGAEKLLRAGDKDFAERRLRLVSSLASLCRSEAEDEKKPVSVYYRIQWNGYQWEVLTLKVASKKK